MGYKVHTVDGKSGDVDLTHIRTKTMQVTIPSPANGTIQIGRMPLASHITRVSAYLVGGAATVQVKNGADDVIATPLAGVAGAWATSVALTAANTDAAAGAALSAVLTGVSGSPTSLLVQVDYTVDVPA